MNREISQSTENENLIASLKEKIRNGVEVLKNVGGVIEKEETAFLAPQFKPETGPAFITWLESLCGPHLFLEFLPDDNHYSLIFYEGNEEEQVKRIVIDGRQIAYTEGTGDYPNFKWQEPIFNIPVRILSEFDSLLPDLKQTEK